MNNKNMKSLLVVLVLASSFTGSQMRGMWPESTAGKVSITLAAGALVGACVFRYCLQNQLIEDAAYRGDVDALRRHAALGGDVEQAAHGGHTLLRIEADLGRLASVEALCQVGADVNRADTAGWTPLMGAAGSGNHLGLMMRIDARAAGTLDAEREAAIEREAGLGAAQAVRTLLNARANVNHNNLNGCGALSVAVRTGLAAPVCALLRAGAAVPEDLNAEGRDLDVQHLLTLARDGRMDEIIRLDHEQYGGPADEWEAEGHLKAV